MFDLTPFYEGENGTVIEFRNVDEYSEFVSFFNKQDNVVRLHISYLEDKFSNMDSFCVRIHKHRFADSLYWMYGPSRRAYESAGNRVINLEDIRIVSEDLGDLSSDEVNLESLLFA